MKIGDLIETNKGERGIVTYVKYMYPDHPNSPVDGVKVRWVDKAPDWHREGLVFSTFAVKEVLSS